jgi:hypothetical protein
VSVADRLDARFGRSEVPDLALSDEISHRARHLLDGHARVYSMLVEQVDGFDSEPPERGLDDLLMRASRCS